MLVIVALTFIATLLIVSAGGYALLEAKDSPKTSLKKRLRRMARQTAGDALPEDLRAEIIRETPPLDRLVARLPFAEKIEHLIDSAGLRISTAGFMLPVIAISVGLFFGVIALTRNYFAAFAAGALVLIAPYMYLKYRSAKRLDKFTEQLPNTLALISRSLRAGHALSASIQVVGQEMDEPTRDLFKTASEQQKLGLRLTDSLANMAERIDSLDLRFFVTAVSINSEVGGNLAEILDQLGETIRERLTIRRQIKVFTAQGRMTGMVLGGLPIAAFFILNTLIPGYETIMFKEKAGTFMLVFAGVAQGIGFLVIKRIINIRI